VTYRQVRHDTALAVASNPSGSTRSSTPNGTWHPPEPADVRRRLQEHPDAKGTRIREAVAGLDGLAPMGQGLHPARWSRYPAGVPVIAPGEVITDEIVDYLRSGVAHGVLIPDAADPSVRTFRVMAT
jgi:hypothetical protein